MSDDQNKSYQDGLYNQPYNGRNWDQWVAGNNAREGGQNNNYYKGPVSSGSSSDWLDAERHDTENIGASAPMSTTSILVLLALPLIIAGIVAALFVIPAALILALPLTPLLKRAEDFLGIENKKSFKSAYLTTIKALSAFGIIIAGLNFLFHFVGQQIVQTGVLANISMLISGTIYAFIAGVPMMFMPLLLTSAFLFTLGLVGFAFVLRRDYGGVFLGIRGFFKGMLTGLPIAFIASFIAIAVARMI